MKLDRLNVDSSQLVDVFNQLNIFIEITRLFGEGEREKKPLNK